MVDCDQFDCSDCIFERDGMWREMRRRYHWMWWTESKNGTSVEGFVSVHAGFYSYATDTIREGGIMCSSRAPDRSSCRFIFMLIIFKGSYLVES